jgi:phosphopantothenate-cysteine ligase
MHIVVTAGGTVERIDPVRAIANSSTGRLGRMVAAALLERDGVRVTYLAPRRAERPDPDPRLDWVEVTDTASVERALRGLAAEPVDAVVHAMAVSDYRVRAVTTAARLAAGEPPLDNSRKVGSDHPDLVVCLERTPKLIALFPRLWPDATLVGFKLLSHVSHDTLLAAAQHVMDAHHCAFVLANDGATIKGDAQVGHLLDRHGRTQTFTTKQAIAAGIAHVVAGP